MQSSEEQTDSKQRVTRSRMRNRVNSNDSEVNDLENRPDTPLRRINSAKKTEMEESVLTPTKRATRGNSVIRTILEEQIIASPLRRVTRRMSSDIMSSPQPSTKPVNLTLNDSDGECVFVSEQPATPRTITTARNKSKEKVKLEEVVEEEPDINDKLNTSLDSNDSNNDLELRNRVIAKSPVVVLNRIHVSPSSNLLSTETKEVGEKIVKALSQSPQKTPSKKLKDAKIDVTKIAEEVEEHDTKIDDDQSEKDKSVTENGDEHDGEQEEQKSETSNVEEQQNASGSVDENDASKNTSANASESLGPLNKGMIDKTPSRLTNGESSAREIVIQKVEYKQPNSSFWNTSITGNSDRIDKAPGGAVGETQIINLSKSIEMQTYRRSSAAQSDSDESEAEIDEKRSMTSLVIDEAEVANSDEDSMTPSEKEDLRENDHIDDGESLGSQDSTGQHGHGSEADTVENDSFIDDEELEDQYSLDSHEELVEKLKESPTKRRSRVIASSSSSDGENEPVISPSKRKSKVIESSSEEEVVPEADKSTSPMKENVTPEKNAEEISPVEKSPSKSPVKRKSLFTFKRPSLASQMQFDTTGSPFSSTQKFGGWLFEGGKDKPELLSTATLLDQAIERKRKRESVVHDAVPKRFKEMSPNESEAVHMDIFEGLITKDNDNDNDNENEVPVDIPKLISHCDEYLEKHNQELKAKVALKRQKKKEKLLKNEEAAKVNAENAETVSPIPKKKKNKSKAKKQKLLADETEKNDMATKLNKQMELLQLKRERKKLKKEMKAAEAAKEKVEEAAPVKIKKKKVKVALPKLSAEPVVAVQQERKTKKRRIEEVMNDEEVEKPKSKKKLKILQEAEPQKYSSNVLQTSSEENIISTVSAKLKKVIPKGLDPHTKKSSLKKKVRAKVVPEPQYSLPRPVWTSAGVFIEESIEPYPFKSTAYKPRNVEVEGASTEFRAIPMKTKKAAAAISKNSKMDLIMQRNKKGRTSSKKNMKNLI